MNEITLKIEFEAFFRNVEKEMNHLSSEEKDRMKTKVRQACENYYLVKSSKKVDEVITRLAKSKHVMVLKQGKGRGVVLMDRTRYIDKCLEHLNTDNFRELGQDKTKTIEEAIQKALYEVKDAIGEEEYRKIYPSGSNPGKYTGL